MKAVILAAGKGTRMGGLTDEMPKPMLQMEGRPILEHIISGVREAGVLEFCIITGWKAEVIEEYFGDGSRCEVSIVMSGRKCRMALARRRSWRRILWEPSRFY